MRSHAQTTSVGTVSVKLLLLVPFFASHCICAFIAGAIIVTGSPVGIKEYPYSCVNLYSNTVMRVLLAPLGSHNAHQFPGSSPMEECSMQVERYETAAQKRQKDLQPKKKKRTHTQQGGRTLGPSAPVHQKAQQKNQPRLTWVCGVRIMYSAFVLYSKQRTHLPSEHGPGLWCASPVYHTKAVLHPNRCTHLPGED